MNHTKKLACGAIFSALGVACFAFGALFESFDASLAVIAGLLIYISVIEFRGRFSLLIWAVISTLSLLLFPFNSAAWMFFLFAGWYPVFKQKIEQIHYLLAWSVKISTFCVAAFVYWVVFTKLLNIPFEETGVWLLVLLILANVVFVLYDILMTRLVTLYIFRWRHRLGFKD